MPSCVMCLAVCFPNSVQDATPPNVVFVFADDLGIGDVGYNAHLTTRGGMPTPVLDSLAEDGTILTRFYSSYACTPARAALMTGRYSETFSDRPGRAGAGGGLIFRVAVQIV